MKVPYIPVPQVQESGQPLPYLSDGGANPNAFGAQIGQALQNTGSTLQEMSNYYYEKQKRTERLRVERDLTNWSAEQHTRFDELRRSADETGNGFALTAVEDFDMRAEEFLTSRVPEDMQDEFSLRLAQLRQGRSSQALTEQNRLQDNFATTTVTEKLDDAREFLDQHPESLDDYTAVMDSIIDSTSWPEDVKENMKREARKEMEKTSYVAGVRDGTVTPGALGIGDYGRVVDKIIGVESSGDRFAKNDKSSATGLGQFVNKTWREFMQERHPDLKARMGDKELLALRNDAALSREATEWYAEKNAGVLASKGLPPTDANLYALHFLGPGGGMALLTASDDTMVSAVLEPGQIRANASILAGKSVGEVKAWLERKMGAGVSSPHRDPRFANIPYDEKQALYADGLRQEAAARAAAQAAAKAQYDEQYNSLLNGLNDGQLGSADIQAARKAGWLTDYDDIAKAQGIISKKDKETEVLSAALQSLANPTYAWDPKSTDDKNMLDAVVTAEDGKTRLGQKDDEYVDSRVLPLIHRTQMIPPDVLGTLQGMIRSPDPATMNWAFGVLDRMEKFSPRAFGQDGGEELTSQLMTWRNHAALYPAEEIVDRMRESRDPRRLKARDDLKVQAQEILRNDLSVNTLIEHFDTRWTQDPSLPPDPLASQEMWNDFSEYYAEQFAETGDKEIAKNNALRLMEVGGWGTTDIGGHQLMKFPPEKYFAPIGNSFDWMAKQAEADIRPLLPEGTNFVLRADQTTERQIQAKQTPTYAVIKQNEFGTFEVLTDDQGRVLRQQFDRTEPYQKYIAEQAELLKKQDAEAAEMREMEKRLREEQRKLEAGEPLDPESWPKPKRGMQFVPPDDDAFGLNIP